jgi:sulfur relay (sulfurtransferase) complex TusBCD TusD component (DsrE family)
MFQTKNGTKNASCFSSSTRRGVTKKKKEGEEGKEGEGGSERKRRRGERSKRQKRRRKCQRGEKDLHVLLQKLKPTRLILKNNVTTNATCFASSERGGVTKQKEEGRRLTQEE